MFADLLPFVDALENIDRIYPFPLDGRASIETSARMQILINCRLNCSSDIGFVDFSASSMIPYPPPLPSIGIELSKGNFAFFDSRARYTSPLLLGEKLFVPSFSPSLPPPPFHPSLAIVTTNRASGSSSGKRRGGEWPLNSLHRSRSVCSG